MQCRPAARPASLLWTAVSAAVVAGLVPGLAPTAFAEPWWGLPVGLTVPAKLENALRLVRPTRMPAASANVPPSSAASANVPPSSVASRLPPPSKSGPPGAQVIQASTTPAPGKWSPFSVLSVPFSVQSVPLSVQSVPSSVQPVQFSGQPVPFSVQPVPFSVQPVPFSVQPVPFSPQPVPFSVQPVPFSVQPVPFSPQPVPFSVQPVPFSVQSMPFSMQPLPFSVQPTPAGRVSTLVTRATAAAAPSTAVSVTASPVAAALSTPAPSVTLTGAVLASKPYLSLLSSQATTMQGRTIQTTQASVKSVLAVTAAPKSSQDSQAGGAKPNPTYCADSAQAAASQSGPVPNICEQSGTNSLAGLQPTTLTPATVVPLNPAANSATVAEDGVAATSQPAILQVRGSLGNDLDDVENGALGEDTNALAAALPVPPAPYAAGLPAEPDQLAPPLAGAPIAPGRQVAPSSANNPVAPAAQPTQYAAGLPMATAVQVAPYGPGTPVAAAVQPALIAAGGPVAPAVLPALLTNGAPVAPAAPYGAGSPAGTPFAPAAQPAPVSVGTPIVQPVQYANGMPVAPPAQPAPYTAGAPVVPAVQPAPYAAGTPVVPSVQPAPFAGRSLAAPSLQPAPYAPAAALSPTSLTAPPAAVGAAAPNATVGAVETPAAPKLASRAMLSEWEEFKRKNNKTYLPRESIKRMARMFRGFVPDMHSDEDRMNIFLARKSSIDEFNRGAKTFRRAINQFADLTPQEVVKKHTGLLLSKRKPRGREFDSRAMGRGLHSLPPSFDWRDRGALTEPRNQATCGCCWAFAATAVLEAKNFIRHQTLVALSEQNLLDCDTLNEKCDGGTPWDAFDWLQSNGGQEQNEVYPYEVMPDQCRQDPARLVRFQVHGYMIVRPSVEENIMGALLSEGPLTIAVNANPATFQDYKEGVYSDADCTSAEDDLRHAVVLVGYGDDPEGGPFWTVRNSWGRDWGEGGYIRISRANNLCGVMTYAVFPSLG